MTWKPYTYNGDCAYANGFLVLVTNGIMNPARGIRGRRGGREENFRCMDVWGLKPEFSGRVDWNILRSRVEVSLCANVNVIGTKGLRSVSRIFN
jgi:hypothetical protein